MLFNSYEFIFVFLPITLILFYLIGSRGHPRAAMLWLVVASLFFYGWWNYKYLILIIGSMLFNYAVGLAIGNRSSKSNKKLLLVCGVVANLGLISYFKYANFFIDSINVAIETSFHLKTIILPLAISFFTFQQIAYIVDTYKEETKEYNLLHYSLFVTFFPQLIAGPIVHHKEMMPQFKNSSIYIFNSKYFSIGFTLFLLGLFKKVVLADTAGLYATPIFELAENGGVLPFYTAWGGALSYTFQLYFDFSGYSDMAIGLALLFGIRLPINFNSPYKSVSIIQFWRCWHITLSRFLRDYLYIPLGGNKKGKGRKYVNIFITMLLGGLWHGAGWTFVAWGALHGVYLLINHLWRASKQRFGLDLSKTNKISIVFSTLLTFLAVVVAWVFFRAESFAGSMTMLISMLNFSEITNITYDDISKKQLIFLSGLIFIVFFLPNTQAFILNADNNIKYKNVILTKINTWLSWKPSIIWALIVGLMFTFILFMLERKSEFLYFQF